MSFEEDLLKPCGPAKGESIAALLKANNQFMEALTKVVEEFKDTFADSADQAEKMAKPVTDNARKQNKDRRAKGVGNATSKDIMQAAAQGAAHAMKLNGQLSGASGGGKGRNNVENSTVKIKTIGDGKADGTAYGHEFAHSVESALQMTLGNVVTGFIGGASAYQLIAKDMIEQEYEFAMGMNQIAYQTKSIANDAPGMQKAFKETSDVVRATGFDLTTYQHALLSATKRGLTDSQSIIKSGLNLGKMMGLNEQEASGIADQFANWNQHLGLDNLQIADVSRGIQDVSRATGLVGQNLLEVVKNSERFMNEMRSAGTLTASSAKNMMMLAANAKKLGVENQMGELMSGLSSGANLLLKTSKENQAMLMLGAQAGGVMKDAMNGTLTETQGGLKKLAKGYEQVFKNISGGIDIGDIDNLSAAKKSQLNIVVQSAFGMGLDDYKRVVDATKNSGRSLEETMMAIDTELGRNATAEEKLAAERKKQQTIMSKSFEFSSKLADAAKEAKTFDEAVDQMKKKMSPKAWQESMQDLSTVAGTFSKELKDKVLTGDTKAISEAMALSAGEALKNAKGKDFTSQIKKAINTKDMSKLRSLQEDMNKEQQKLGAEEITALDPMAKAAMELKVLNENLRSFTGPAIVALTSLVGSVGIIAAMLVAGVFNMGSLATYFDVFETGVQAILGKSVKQAASVSATVAAETAVGTVAKTGFSSMTGAMGVAAGGTGEAAVLGGAAAAEGGGLVAAASGTAAAMAPVAIALAVIAAAAGGVIGSLNAGAAAADLFGTSMEDVTLAQHYAAKAAGGVTGALNFLTLGIFNKWLGATGAATEALAKMYEKLPIMSAIFALFDVINGAIWGTVKAIWNVVAGIGELVYLVLEPFGALFSAIGDVVMAILSPLSAFSTKLSETGSLFQIVSDIIGGLGMSIRWALRILGKVVGFIIKVLISPIVAIIKGIAGLVSGFLKPVGRSLDALMQIGMGILNFFQGLFTFDFSKMWSGLLNALKGVIKYIINSLIELPVMIINGVLGAVAGIAGYMGSLFDDVGGTLGSILQATMAGYKFIANLANALIDTLDGVWEVLVGIFTLDMDSLQSGISKVLFSLPSMLWGTVTGVAGWIKDIFMGIPMSIINSFKSVLIDFPKWLWTSLMSGITSLAKNDWIGPIFEPFLEILTPLKEAFDGLWSVLEELFSVVGEFWGSFGAPGTFSWMEVLQTTVKALSTVIGGFIRIALLPLRLIVGVIATSVTIFTSILQALVDGIKGWIEYIRSIPIIGSYFKSDEEEKPAAKAVSNSTSRYQQPTTSLVQEGIAKGGPEYLAKNANSRFESMSGLNTNTNTNSISKFDSNANSIVPPSLDEMRLRTAISSGAPSVPLAMRDEISTSTSSAQPTPMYDVHTKMQREQAATLSETKRSSVPGTSELVAINENQLKYLILMHGDLEKVIDLMTPSGNSSGFSDQQQSASTKSKTKPANSTNFHQWQFGKYTQNASTNVVTDGR